MIPHKVLEEKFCHDLLGVFLVVVGLGGDILATQKTLQPHVLGIGGIGVGNNTKSSC